MEIFGKRINPAFRPEFGCGYVEVKQERLPLTSRYERPGDVDE